MESDFTYWCQSFHFHLLLKLAHQIFTECSYVWKIASGPEIQCSPHSLRLWCSAWSNGPVMIPHRKHKVPCPSIWSRRRWSGKASSSEVRCKTRCEDLGGVAWAKSKDCARQKEQRVCSVEGEGTGKVLKVDSRDDGSCKLGNWVCILS